MAWSFYNSSGKLIDGVLDSSITNAKMVDDAIDSDEIVAGAIDNAHLATGIDAVKLADGSVTNAELQYINTLSSNAQTQLAAKQATIDSSARLDAASIGANGNVSNTEYGYLSGVTSDIQTQISAAGGAVTREGGNTTEATTTSTSHTDLRSATSLTIAQAQPFFVVVNGRMTTGGTENFGFGVKLNTTDFGIIQPLGGYFWAAHETNRNEVANGMAFAMWGSRADLTNYDRAGFSVENSQATQTATVRIEEVASVYANTNDAPAAEITSFIVVGRCSSGSVTGGADELHVYSLGTS